MMPRIAVLGCGQWGANHVRTLAEIGCLVAVSDADEAKAQALAERHGVDALKPEDAIGGPGIDALVIALPPRLHPQVAQAAMRAGRDVLVEKPIALDTATAAASAAVAVETGRILMVGHVLRFHPVFEAFQEAVAGGRVGDVRHLVSTRLGLGRFLGMDAVWDLAPHDISLVLAIAGTASAGVETLARTVLSDEIDVADIRMEFESGISAEIHVSRISPFRDRRFSAIGTDGMLTFDDLAPEGQKLVFHGHRVFRDGARFGFTSGDPEYLPTVPGLPLDRELRHFIACIETREAPRTGPEEAVETVRLLEKASPGR